MSGALTWQPIQPIDIGGAFARGQQLQENRLSNLLRQRQLEQGQQMDQFLAGNAQGFASSDPTKRMNILAQLASMGPQGLAMALPQMQTIRDNQDLFRPGGASASPGAPATNPAPGGTSRAAIPPAELAPIIAEASRTTGVPVAVLNAVYQQESQFGQDPRATSSGGGIGQIISSTARNPGYGMQPISDADRLNPARAIPWSAQYLAARARAAGVTDWNDPAQVNRALAAYNGGGDPNYVANVRRHMGQGDGPSVIQTAGGAPPARTEGGAPSSPQTRGQQVATTPDGLVIVPGFDMDAVRRARSMPGSEVARRYLDAYNHAAQQTLSLAQRNEPPETWRDSFRVRDGRKVPGQESSRGRFEESRQDRNLQTVQLGEDGPQGPGIYAIENGKITRRLGAAPGSESASPFSREGELRREFMRLAPVERFMQSSALYESVNRSTERARTALNGGANDQLAELDAVIGIANLFDPGSVVREGEVANVVRTQGLPGWLQERLGTVMGGQRMTPEMLDQIRAAAADRMRAYRAAVDPFAQNTRDLATRYGYNPDNIIPAPLRQADVDPYSASPVQEAPGRGDSSSWGNTQQGRASPAPQPAPQEQARVQLQRIAQEVRRDLGPRASQAAVEAEIRRRLAR